MDYGTEAVRAALQRKWGGPERKIHSAVEKNLMRLGDRAAIALIKLLPPEDFADSNVARDILAILRSAFCEPALIEDETDRSPAVSKFLLRVVADRAKDEATRKDIDEFLTHIEG